MEDVEEKIEGSLQFTPNELLQWSQWQLLDSVLPTGGFAHSFGVEAAIQARKTSISQGSALLRVAAAVFQEVPYFKTMREMTLASGAVRFHHAPIFGLVCGLLGLNAETSQKTYLFITMRDVVSAATRLNLVGPLGAAVLQHQLAANAEELSKKWMNRPVEEACQTNPLLDTIQGCHGYLFSRLFCS
uniref:Urease accessory protein F n=1 Tax=Solanum tuberosum TaxID=4113 RepID=M1C8W8_SOLTU